MLFDASLAPVPISAVSDIARAAEAHGFAALWGTETMHDPFLPGVLAAEHTQQLSYGTAVAIAFARSPATLAYSAWDLAQFSQGRFILGLGTQVKPHIERRFGMPWPPSVVAKLREQIQAIRAFWHTWQTGTKLDFRGEYYRLNLMSPFFNPGPIAHPQIPIFVAGVNTGLARLAGECAEGFLVHPLHTPRYLSDILIPAIEQGLTKSGRNRQQLQIAVAAFIVTSAEEDFFVRAQIAFYASTPSYRPVMQLHGWESTAENLSALAGRGQWESMPSLITDEMLDTFAVVCSPLDLPARLLDRYRHLADRLSIYQPFTPGERDPFWRNLIQSIMH